MAYDNLMTYGAAGIKSKGWLPRELGPMAQPWKVHLDLMLLVCAGVVVLLSLLTRPAQKATRSRPTGWRGLPQKIRWCLLPVGVPVLAFWLLMSPTAMGGHGAGSVVDARHVRYRVNASPISMDD
jgi:hypothetical protein